SNSARPDIYLLVLDEYAGARSLQAMGFDNRSFLDSLRRSGFWVATGSRSNYDFTPFSMASMLQMQYIDSSMERCGDDARTILSAVHAISDNETMRILRREGYDIRFEAPFDNSINPAPTLNEFGDFAWKQLFGNSLPGRVRRDFARNIDPFSSLFRPVYGYNNAVQRRKDLERYRAVLNATIDSNPARPPRFVYQHLLLTHHPYLFDSAGKPLKHMADASEERSAYLDQVCYANALQLEQVDRILKGGRRNTVIILLSDHGYRQGGAAVSPFDNLQAVYYPNRDYSGLDVPESPVNVFRHVFNRHFEQHWPLLPFRSVPVRYR
ncbi:MAG: hypothetical protein EOP50_03830, partial [Sphingobacteriales bacterium]